MTTTGTRPSSEDYYRNERPGSRSVGQLMREITEDISTLFRKEIELAKQEVGESIAVKTKGAVIIAIAGVFGLLALMFVLLALRDGLDTFLWQWVADLVTALVLLVCGGIGALIAKKKLQAPFKTELTKKTIKDDVELAKSLRKRPGSATTKTGV
ncbi:MAG TPA: phage holin family protein [Actinomycetota bacterium]|nr:phage holin family protein [Actinomycetota bacterium]